MTSTERLARLLHEASREAVGLNFVVNAGSDGPRPFIEWNELSMHARNGRILQASWLLAHADEVLAAFAGDLADTIPVRKEDE